MKHVLSRSAWFPLAALCAWTGGHSLRADEPINPFPRQTCRTEKLHEWTFERGPAGWRAQHDCRLAARDGRLVITSTGDDPYLSSPVPAEGGSILVRFRARCNTAGRGQFFWTTQARPNTSERNSVRFDLVHDGQWHDYEVPMRIPGKLRALRFDPGGGAGTVEIERMELHRTVLHPLEIAAVRAEGRTARASVKNHAGRAMTFTVGGRTHRADAGQIVEATVGAPAGAGFAAVTVRVQSAGLPDVTRTVHLYGPRAGANWPALTSGPLTVRIAPDGSGAVLLRGGRTAGVLAPIVALDGAVPKLQRQDAPGRASFRGKGVAFDLSVADGELTVAIRSDRPCEGPRLRALGTLEQGLFAGLEYLGKGERSSSTLDIETPEHLRYAPDPLKVTMPLMAVVTDRATAAMTWEDTSLRPVFAAPNFFDGTGDHLMALRGRQILARIRLAKPEPIEEAILWAVKKHGLPPLPKAPRSRDKQWALCLKSLRGPIRGEGGWGHCAEAKWGRAPYADMASTIWRLTGTAPELPRLQPGGAHVRNDAAYFVTGRGEQWLQMRRNQARGIARRQKADGSFRYAGKYRRGHFEDTSSGACARPAWELLEFAYLTGDPEALAAGLKTLEYMKRFRTPRGAQTWELSLHTPDILASAYLVGAYVRGYELTKRKEYVAEARRWALSGVPFVYLWGTYPTMRYATVPVYGATNWRAPNWIGLPVQWCGGVYAYFLTKLAPHDRTLDWNALARGILIAGEQMQYPDGHKLVGCLPDVFRLRGQQRAGPSINPCALASLRLAMESELDSLAVAVSDDGRHRVCAPVPVTIRQGKAHLRARKGTAYQVVIDGERIVSVQSRGRDVVPLAGGGGDGGTTP